MAPDPKPSSSSGFSPPPATIQNIHKLIHDIPLPKAGAKKITVSIDTWHALRHIAATLVQQPKSPDTTRITELTAKIDALTAEVKNITTSSSKPLLSTIVANASGQTPLSLPRLTAAPVAAQTVPRNTDSDIILTPIDRNHPPFAADSILSIREHFNNLMDSIGEPDYKACAVSRFRGHDLRITLNKPEAVTWMAESGGEFLTAFHPNLELQERLHPVIAHRVLTASFDPTTWASAGAPGAPAVEETDVGQLCLENAPRLGDLEGTLRRVQYIGRQSLDQLRATKVHASIVLYFSDPHVADECISRKISWQGTLLRTEKYRPQPVQCYNCFRFGHIASHCRRPATCGKCSEPHCTAECPCPKSPPCKDGTKCTHIVFRCAIRGCGAAHAATSPVCPVRQELFERVAREHAATGPYYAR